MTHNSRELFLQIEKLLSANPNLHLYELAHMLGCSHPTIEKAVKRNTQLSFRDYKQGKLLEKAEHLSSQGCGAAKLGLHLGYRWPENFFRMKRSRRKLTGEEGYKN